MMLRRCLAALPRFRRSAFTFRPELQVLEDRTVPSTVNSLLDLPINLGDAVETLRDAVARYNGNILPAPNLINFSVAGVITLLPGAGGQLNITRPATLTIDGPAAGPITVNGAAALRLFQVLPGVTVNMDDLNLTNGNAGGGPGGAIFNQGSLALLRVNPTTNTAVRGGAVFADGILANTLTVTNCVFGGNTAAQFGGGIESRINTRITNSNFGSNRAVANDGGAIEVDIVNAGLGASAVSVVLNNNTFSSNRAGGSGGAVEIELVMLSLVGQADVTFAGTNTFRSNVANGVGAANGFGGGMNLVLWPGQGAVNGSVATATSLPGSRLAFFSNLSEHGGALAVAGRANGNSSAARASLENIDAPENLGGASAFPGNNARADGGGMTIESESRNAGRVFLFINNSTFAKGGAPLGAGVHATAEIFNAGGESTIFFYRSTIDNNRATIDGGGLYGTYLKTAAATVDPVVGLINCTIAENAANSDGGGLYLTRTAGGGADVAFGLFGVTVARNATPAGAITRGGGMFVDPVIPAGSAPAVGNSLFALNTAPLGPDVFGNVVSLTVLSIFPGVGPGRNLVTNASGSAGWDSDTLADDDILNPPAASLLLGPLALTAPGTTRIIAILAGSVGLDASVGVAGSLLDSVLFEDQRGVVRPQDGAPPVGALYDIGAYERRPFDP